MEPLFAKPAGPTKLRKHSDMETQKATTCEICGTHHPDREKAYGLNKFLGRWVVEECCGAVIDQVYYEHGEDFTIAYVKECSENLGRPTCTQLKRVLEQALITSGKR